VVEERSAARSLEEVVGHGVPRVAGRVQVLVDRQAERAVVPHRKADRVAAGDVAVHFATVQLVLLLVEAVHEVACAPSGERVGGVFQHAVGRKDVRRRACPIRREYVVVDTERRVHEPARKRATFCLWGEHSFTSTIGSAWEKTPWQAVQRAAWETLTRMERQPAA